MPLSFLRGAKRLRWRETDRLLALALQIHEDSLCPGCGQLVTESMEPALAEYWATMPPVRCFACTALADAQEGVKEFKHPHALRHVVGMTEGWEAVLEPTPDH